MLRFQNTDVNTEPSYNKGWGFCSDAPIQDSCNTVIPEVPDTSDIPTTVLSDEYCVEKLEANLVVEQVMAAFFIFEFFYEYQLDQRSVRGPLVA